MKDLQGKVAVVTGAASGIGAAMAFRFASEGMKVVLADIESEALVQTTARLKRTGAEVLGVRTDVSKENDVEVLASQSLDAFGAVHVVCNNAGVGSPSGPIWERTVADWQWVLGVNLWGVIHGVRVFVPILLKQGVGHVVNTASIGGFYTSPLIGIYDSSKHAVVAISEALHFELSMRKTQVRTSVLCPGPLHTGIRASERNRPPELANPGFEPSGQTYEGAAPPDPQSDSTLHLIGERVVRAIQEEQFYVLTHPELNPYLRERMENVLHERNPTNVDSRQSRFQRMQNLKGNRPGPAFHDPMRSQIVLRDAGKGDGNA